MSVEALEVRCLLSFNPAVSYPVGLGPSAVAVGDVTGDTRPDLVTANSNDSSVSVLSGNADGTFQAAQTSATGSGPLSVALGDFDGDGKGDVVTANAGAGDLSVLLHNPDGTLAAPQSITLPGQIPPGYTGSTPLPQNPRSVAVGDLNGDGSLDLVATGITAFDQPDGCGYYGCYYHTVDNGYVNVLLGDGHGGFAAPSVRPDGLYPNSVALGHFDSDSNLDVVTADASSGSASVLPGDGHGNLGAPAGFGTGYSPQSVAVGDLDGDGRLDLVTANDSSVSVLLRNPDGSVRPAQNLYLGSSARSVAVGDVNQDGKMDLVAMSNTFHCTSYGYYGGCYDGFYTGDVTVLLGYGEGSFALPRTATLADEYAGPGVLRDFNGDGFPDVAAPIGSSSVSVATNAADWVLPSAVRISDVTITEGNAGTVNAVFTVTRLIGDGGPVTIPYSTADGTATAGSDYVTTSGTLTFGPGQTTATIAVPVKGDRLGEPDETFYVLLSGVANADILDGVGVGTIADDEPRISIGDVTVTEGNTGTTAAVFTVSLSAPSDVAVSVTYSTSNGGAAAGKDYVAIPATTLTFAPGEISKTITVQVNGDTTDEYDESFFVNLSSPANGYILDGQGVGTILDNDPPPTISIGDASIREGDRGTKVLVFTVTLSAPSEKDVWVSYATADGTAKTADNDYRAASGTLYFAPGQTTVTISVVVIGDKKKEPSETLFVNLSGAGNGVIADGQGLGTILDDDTPVPHGKGK